MGYDRINERPEKPKIETPNLDRVLEKINKASIPDNPFELPIFEPVSSIYPEELRNMGIDKIDETLKPHVHIVYHLKDLYEGGNKLKEARAAVEHIVAAHSPMRVTGIPDNPSSSMNDPDTILKLPAFKKGIAGLIGKEIQYIDPKEIVVAPDLAKMVDQAAGYYLREFPD